MPTSSEPSSPLGALRRRARILERIRAFFRSREVLEVETPVLGRGGIADETLSPFATRLEGAPGGTTTLWLQTSPEVFMKRLLAGGSGPIFQLARVFRNGEAGERHNPEFTMLEWYRPGWDTAALMDEVEALYSQLVPGRPPARRATYGELFGEALQVDPHRATPTELAARAGAAGVSVPGGMPRDEPGPWLDLLFAERVEPGLAAGPPVFVTEFPAGRAALAAHLPGEPRREDRFELLDGGLELANGFRELTDAVEQRRRFEAINQRRRDAGLSPLPLDERFLEALPAMPPTSGVALGVERLLMRALDTPRLADVMAFPLAEL